MSRFGRRLGWVAGGLVAGVAGWTLGAYNGRRQILTLEPEQHIINLSPKVAQLTAKLQEQGYVLDASKRSVFMDLHQQHMFSRSVLTRKGRLAPSGPVELRNRTTGDLVFIYHMGADLLTKDHFAAACTTIFDEGLAMAAFPKLPNKIGVTGTLDLGPIKSLPPADGLVVLYARPTTASGRRSESRGELVGLTSGKTLATGHAVMVEPWWGKYISLLL